MTIFRSLRGRLPWFAGLLTPWAGAWLLLGLRQLPLVRETPHPFLKGLQLTGVMLEAIRDWALLALLAHLLVGLLVGLLVLVWEGLAQIRAGQVGALSFPAGLKLGTGTLLWIHGLLFLMVPSALATLPGLNRIPVGLLLSLLLGIGAWLLYGLFQGKASFGILRWLGALATLGMVLLLPHDLFRSWAPAPNPLASGERRVLIFGADGMKKDLVDQAYRKGGAPKGVHPICAVPATRMAWNTLLGGDPAQILRDLVMPYRAEIENPGRLTLLEHAREQGLKVAFVIDDSLTPSYGLQPTYFSEVVEPNGGWKHWFSLGLGHTWPVFSWAENYVSATETNNPWAAPEPFLRDVTRAVRRNHWTNAHFCQQHDPIFPRLTEIQRLRPWTWLAHPGRAFLGYSTLEAAQKDGFKRATPLADPREHHILRGLTFLKALRPFLDTWAQEFPDLSGVFTADHGETHVPLVDEKGIARIHSTGVHGFQLDADSTWVPLYPFGRTEAALPEGTVYSWFNLRDDLGRWVAGGTGPLRLTGDAQGWVLKAPSIRATHLEASSLPEADAKELGIRPVDLASMVYLTSMGTWFAENPPPGKQPWKLSTALVRGDRIIAFNPSGKGRQVRTEFQGYRLVGIKEVTDTEVEEEERAFGGHRPSPWRSLRPPP